MDHNITSIGEILFDVFPDNRVMGGAPFNFIYHIRKITGSGNFVSRIGSDAAGKEVSEFLKERNIPEDYIQADSDHPTGQAVVSVQSNGEPRFDIIENCAYDFIAYDNRFSELIKKKNSLLYFGTLAQRSPVSRNTIWSLLNMNMPCFCDVNLRQSYYNHQILEKSLNAADVVKLNKEELEILGDLYFGRKYEPEDAAKALKERFRITMLSITMGADGALIIGSNNEKSFCRPKKNKRVIDTVGAGDAYSAVVALGYLKGWHIEKINYTASGFASDICTVKGALPSGDSVYERIIEEFSGI